MISFIFLFVCVSRAQGSEELFVDSEESLTPQPTIAFMLNNNFPIPTLLPTTITPRPTKMPSTLTPTAEPTPVIQPRLQYRVRSAIYPDKCLSVQGRSIEEPVLAPCRPATLFSNQSFVSITRLPRFEGDIVNPGEVQLVNGVVWTWIFPVDPSTYPNYVRLTDVKVYGTTTLLNYSKCASVPKMNDAAIYPVYWFPCIVNSSNIFILEPILLADYSQSPPTSSPTPGMNATQLSDQAPYGTLPPGTQNTPPPATCQPVMMQHLGRHGSRHATDITQFMAATSLMVNAQRQTMLTPFGTELLRRAQQVVFNLRNIELSSLTPQGQQEVYNYSSRMARNFPSIFANGPRNTTIVADSTDLDRTLSSRKQALYALRDAGVNISDLVSTFAPSVCTTEYNILRAFEGCRESVLYADDGANFMPASELKVKTMANSTNYALDFYNQVFVEGFEVPKNVADEGRVYDRIKFVDDLWRYVCGVGAAYNLSDVNLGVCSLIPKEVGELLAYAEDVVNYRTYGRYTPSATTYRQSCLLHQNVHADFVDYVAGNTNKRAHLRFAHAETVMPYIQNMNLYTRDPYFLQDADWHNREFNSLHFRMASNVQKVLYKCNGGNYYVKMLLNEVETVIPGCNSVYCPWERYNELASGWTCNNDQFKQLCDGLIVFCGSAREIALSKQAKPNAILAGPPVVTFGSSPFDQYGPFASKSPQGKASAKPAQSNRLA